MTKDELYRSSMFNENMRIQILQNDYSNYIYSVCDKLIGFSDQYLVERILKEVNDFINNVSMKCDISSLVFDCTRKEIIKTLRTDSVSYKRVNNKLLMEADLFSNVSGRDILRLDIALALMSSRQRHYFLERYYYLDDKVEVNTRYEKEINKLFSGRGISKYRFEYFNIPKTRVATNEYVGYLDKLNEYYLDYITTGRDALMVLPAMSKVSNIVLFAEREHRIAKYAIPISLLIILCFCVGFMFIWR